MTKVVVVLKTSEGGLWVVPQLEAILSRGAEVVVVIPEAEGRLARALGDLEARRRRLTIVRTSFDFRFAPTIGSLSGLGRFRTLLRSIDADAALYHLYASALASRFALAGTRTRRVHMVAGPLYLEAPLIRMFERRAVGWDDALIAGSEYTAARYAALGVRPSRLFAIPYGVDIEHFSPSPDERRPESGDPFRVVMVAYVYAPKRMVHAGKGIKGHDVLLSAWRRFARRHGDVELHLVGGGFDARGERLRQCLIAEFDDLIRCGAVRWTASVEDVRDAYRTADVSVSPSLSENHGAALEAGSMGVPSIVSDAGGLPETVRPEGGWVVPAGSVDDLDAALESAYREWASGDLAERGRRARAHVVGGFDRAISSKLVADVVLGHEAAPG